MTMERGGHDPKQPLMPQIGAKIGAERARSQKPNNPPTRQKLGRQNAAQEISLVSHQLITQIKEKQFQAMVEQLANLYQWRHYHTFDSRRSVSGYPDLTLAHAGQKRVIFAELKKQDGRVSKTQWQWLDDLAAAGQEVYVWRPADWVDGTIHSILKQR